MMPSSKPLTSRKSLRGLSMFTKDGNFSNPTTPTTPGAPETLLGTPGTATPGTPTNRRSTPTRNDRNGRDRTERDTGRNGASRRPGTPSASSSGLFKVMEGTSAADVGSVPGPANSRDAVRTTERTTDTVRRASSARTTQRTREPSQLGAQISRPPSRMPSIPGPSRQPNQPVTPSLLNPTVYTPPTREQRAAAAASRGGRNTSTSSAPGSSQQHHLTSSVSFPAQGQPSRPMHRSRPSAPENGQRTNAWEDSTIASSSMFGDRESRDGRAENNHERQINGGAQQHPQLVRGRHYSDTAFPRSNTQQAQHPAITQQPKSARPTLDHDENLPFVIGEGGILTVIEAPRNRNDPDAVALNKTIEAITKEREPTIKIEDDYEGDRAAFNSTPTKQLSAFQRARLPHRDPRKGGSVRGGNGGYTSDIQSPGRSSDTNAADLEKSRIEQRLRREREHERLREQEREKERIRKEAERRERERKRQQEMQHQRSTVFDDMTPVESEAPPMPTPNFNNTQAAVVPSTSSAYEPDVSSPGNVTPKASGSRHLHPTQIPKQQPLPPQLKDASIALARTTSRRAKEKEIVKPKQPPKPASTSPLPILEQAKKRRLSSLDYDDAQLYKMPYTTLLTQSFDEDPQEEALKQQAQATTKLDDRPPENATLEDKLQHYKTKPTAQQTEFFTHMKIAEWDEAGDWFLDQFTSVMKKIKDARKAKRKMVEEFEVEIAEREGAVRGKIEKIGRTLENLKEEGRTMMQGKEMDLED